MKQIKTIDCVQVYDLLKSASLGRMAAADKISVIKTLRAMRSVAEAFTDFRSDASQRLRGENHDKMAHLAQLWQQREDAISPSEKAAVKAYYDEYARNLRDCIAEEEEKPHDIDVRQLSADGFTHLLDANPDWTAEQIMRLEELLVE